MYTAAGLKRSAPDNLLAENGSLQKLYYIKIFIKNIKKKKKKKKILKIY